MSGKFKWPYGKPRHKEGNRVYQDSGRPLFIENNLSPILFPWLLLKPKPKDTGFLFHCLFSQQHDEDLSDTQNLRYLNDAFCWEQFNGFKHMYMMLKSQHKDANKHVHHLSIDRVPTEEWKVDVEGQTGDSWHCLRWQHWSRQQSEWQNTGVTCSHIH